MMVISEESPSSQKNLRYDLYDEKAVETDLFIIYSRLKVCLRSVFGIINTWE